MAFGNSSETIVSPEINLYNEIEETRTHLLTFLREPGENTMYSNLTDDLKKEIEMRVKKIITLSKSRYADVNLNKILDGVSEAYTTLINNINTGTVDVGYIKNYIKELSEPGKADQEYKYFVTGIN